MEAWIINNFHTLVILSTILTYIYFKTQLQRKKGKSNLIYIISVPIILYSGFYYYKYTLPGDNHPNFIEKPASNTKSESNSDLLSIPYPQSSTF